MWPGVILLNGLGFPNVGQSNVWLSDLALLPGTLVVFCAAARLGFRGLVIAIWLAFLIPAGTCVLLLKMGRLWENVPWTMAGIATAVAIPLLLLERESWSGIGFRGFQPLGKISYGLYLLHVPIAAFVIWLYPWHEGMFNYLGGVLAWVALTVASAWLCEARLQPVLVSYFRARRANSPKITGNPVKP